MGDANCEHDAKNPLYGGDKYDVRDDVRRLCGGDY